MNFKIIIMMIHLVILSSSAYALQIDCSNQEGVALSLTGDNSSALDLGSGEPVADDLSAAYHMSIYARGTINDNGDKTVFASNLIMMRRARFIYTSNDTVSLYWDSPTSMYKGVIGDAKGEFSCSLDDF